MTRSAQKKRMPDAWNLFSMWAYPKMASRSLISFVVILAARLVFWPAQLIPFYLDFNPGIFLVPLLASGWGPSAVWGAVAAALVGDAITGLWSGMSAFNAAGVFTMGWIAQATWDHPRHTTAGNPGWPETLHFITVSWCGAFALAAWQGLGAEIMRLYAFPYFCSVALVHHLFFCTLLGVSFYRIAARDYFSRFGNWRQLMRRRAGHPLRDRARIWLWIGALGAATIGILSGWIFFHIPPWPPLTLGITCGPVIEALVIPFLLVQLLTLLRVVR